MSELMDLTLKLIELGVTGIMLVVFIRLFKMTYKDYKDLINNMNQERQQFYAKFEELVKETSKALADKNISDYALAKSIDELINLLRERE